MIVRGEPGIGKSTFVRQICHFISDHESKNYSNGVLYIQSTSYTCFNDIKALIVYAYFKLSTGFLYVDFVKSVSKLKTLLIVFDNLENNPKIKNLEEIFQEI